MLAETAWLALAALPLAAWIGVALRAGRGWGCRPVADDEPDAPDPESWPAVVAVVPARNEAAVLPLTLPALLAQDYPGRFEVLLVDDRSTDGTADTARAVGAAPASRARLTVIRGAALPEGWIGKPWAMQQGFLEARRRGCESVLLTDADILHAPDSLRRLVAAASAHGSALESRMARLACESPAERLLVPAFVWFFGLLYPMPRVNDPRDATAAAAGGCMLLSREACERLGDLSGLRDRVIDDVSLARLVKGAGLSVRLALSRWRVRSTRRYPRLADFWVMVRRTAFTELRHSWLRLAGCLLALTLTFLAPPATLLVGLAAWSGRNASLGLVAAALGAAAWTLSSLLFLPAVRLYDLPAWRCLTLPLAGILYGGMTVDSARLPRHAGASAWRSPGSAPSVTGSG